MTPIFSITLKSQNTNICITNDTEPAAKSCFHDNDQQLALSLLIILKLEEKLAQIDERAKKYELKRENNDLKHNDNCDFLTAGHETFVINVMIKLDEL